MLPKQAIAQHGEIGKKVKRILCTSVRLVTFVDPLLQEPYGHAVLRPGKTYKNPERGPKKLERTERYNARRTKFGRMREFVRGPK